MATKLFVLVCFLFAVVRCEDDVQANSSSIVVDQPVDDVSNIVGSKDEQPADELAATVPKNTSAAVPAPAIEANATLTNDTQTLQETNTNTNETGPYIAYAKQDVKEGGLLSGIGQLWNNITGKQAGVSDISLKSFPGTTCKTDSDCAEIANSACRNNRCLCKGPEYTNSIFSLDKCVKVPILLGDYCEDSSFCNKVVPASECILDICKCPPLFVFADGVCLVKQSLGSPCSNTAQCLEIPSGLCLQGVCACPDPLLPSPTSNRCLQPAEQRFQSTCLEDIQCMNTFGDNGRCNNGGCICKNGYHYNSTQCILDRQLGSSCETNEDCAISVTVEPVNLRTCTNHNCTCIKGYKSLTGEDRCVRGAAHQLQVSIVWLLCICIAKFYF